MWEFYLIASEFSFRYGKHMVFQIQLSKKADAVPLTRSYIVKAEADMTARARPEPEIRTP
jgi:cyclopropane-fatty-acyl-phospholipid synthase